MEREERVVPFEVAKLAKMVGFNLAVTGSYTDNHDGAEDDKGNSISDTVDLDLSEFMVNNSPMDLSNEYYSHYAAPTREVLSDWLERNHQIYIDVDTDCTTEPKFAFYVRRFVGNPKDLGEREWYWETIKHEGYLYRTRIDAWNEALETALANLLINEEV